MLKKNIEEFIAAERARNDAYWAEKIHAYFTAMDMAERHMFAMDAFTRLPFEALIRFHNWAFAGVNTDITVEEYAARDAEGHFNMQKENIAAFYAPDNNKTDTERYEYFSGISSVFPLMMTANYHKWLSGNLGTVQDAAPFIEAHVPLIETAYHRPLKAAYDARDTDGKIKIYTEIAHNNLNAILRDYYDWLDTQTGERP